MSEYQAGVAAFEAGDFAAAYAAWLPLAHAGDGDAQRNVALLLQTGRGVTPDSGAAFYWYRLAAEAGDAAAANSIAMMYLAGDGLPSDYIAAQAWLLKAAAAGFAPALYNLGLLHERGLGVDPDDRTALGWYLLAAEAGQPAAVDRMVAARNRLARLDGPPAENPQGRLSAGLNWAIVRGLTGGEPALAPAGALTALAETGPVPGIPVTPATLEPALPAILVAEAAEARRGVNRVALADRAAAAGGALQRGDWQLALAVLVPAAVAGDAASQFLLGNLYADGRGMPPDPAAAVAWWAQAATQGHQEAALAVERVGALLDPEQFDRATRLWAARIMLPLPATAAPRP